MEVLEIFHHSITRQIVGMTARRRNNRECEWALVGASLKVTGLWPMREYVWRRQMTIVEYVTGRPVYGLCTGAEKMEGYTRLLRVRPITQPTQAERKVG